MAISSATSICVRPSKNRRLMMRLSRGDSFSIACVMAMRSNQLSSVLLTSHTLSITYTESPFSEYTGSYRETGSTMASSASATSSFAAPSSDAISSTRGSRESFAASVSRTPSALYARSLTERLTRMGVLSRR